MSIKYLDDTAISTSPGLNTSLKKMLASTKNLSTIKPDSPRTIEACLELGLKIEDLQQKTYDDFIEPGVPEDIVKVRYEHYQKRYNAHAREVIRKKRELSTIIISLDKKVKYRKEKVVVQNVNEMAKTAPNFAPNSTRNTMIQNALTPTKVGFDFMTPRTFYETEFSTSISPAQANTIKKTITLLRSSHDGPNELRTEINLTSMDKSFRTTNKFMFETKLLTEIDRFNKIKEMKQKEALGKYGEEIKRIKSIESMYEKERKRTEFEKKQKQARQSKKLENRRILEEKMKKVKETEAAYKSKKKEDERKFKQRLEEAQKKFHEEAEARMKHLQEMEELKEKRRKNAENKRKNLNDKENEYLEELKTSIERKFHEHNNKYEEALNDKVRRIKSELLSVDDHLQKNKEIQQKHKDDFVQQAVVRYISREESVLAFQKKCQKDFKERQKNNEYKLKKIEENIKGINDDYIGRMNDIKQRFQKVEENFEQKKEEEEKNMKIKQEKKRLKMQENLDNFDRNRRRMEYEQNKIICKEKVTQEKLATQKNQKEVLQRIRIEAALQAKIECERINQNVNSVAKILHVKDESDIKNLKSGEFQKSVRILKKVIKPEYLQKIPELVPTEIQPQGQGNQPNQTNGNAKSPIKHQKS